MFVSDDAVIDYNISSSNKYRHGILYFGFGPIEIGWDSEKIRSSIQNSFHDLPFINTPHFRDLSESENYEGDKFYFQYNSGGLW